MSLWDQEVPSGGTGVSSGWNDQNCRPASRSIFLFVEYLDLENRLVSDLVPPLRQAFFEANWWNGKWMCALRAQMYKEFQDKNTSLKLKTPTKDEYEDELKKAMTAFLEEGKE